MDKLLSSYKKPLVIAHRGFRAVAPENTLSAARRGFEAGADWWELDVAESSDGVLVVLHDDSLLRTTNAQTVYPGRFPWTVYEFTFDEIRVLDAGSWFVQSDPFGQIAAGKVGSDELSFFKGIKVPTLQECLEITREYHKKVNIEIKSATGFACDTDIVEKTVALIQSMEMQDSVLVSCFNHDYLMRVKKADPRIATAALTENPLPEPVVKLGELAAVALHPDLRTLDEATVQAVKNAGFAVNAWTVNTETDMKRLLSWGVSGLITDFVDKAREIVDLTVF